MKTVYFFIFVVLITGALFIKTALGHVQSESYSHPEFNISHPLSPLQLSSQQATAIGANDTDGQSGIQATGRISIPFGIAPTLPLFDNGEELLVLGHGGCTAGETVSVVISVTQTTGASAVGQTEELCTGLLQQWNLTATTTTATNLDDTEAAEACGLAVTRSDGSVTDTFDWCRDVAFASLHYHLPIIRAEP